MRNDGVDLIPSKRSRRGRATRGVRLAYPRLASAIGLAPLSIPVSLIVLTGVAWALMLHHAISMSEPMGWDGAMGVEMRDATFTLGGLGIFLAVWTVMMGAMMLPSAAPMILTFAAAQARRSQRCRAHLDVRLPSATSARNFCCDAQRRSSAMAW